MHFEPIAIVGQACVLPGALNPSALWENVQAGRDLTSRTPLGAGDSPRLDSCKTPKPPEFKGCGLDRPRRLCGRL